MKAASAAWMISIYLALTSWGYAQISSGATKSAPRATIEGIVTKDPTGERLKKAVIELIGENQAEAGDYTAVSDEDGMFRIEGIVPGRYHLFAEHTGFLETDKHHARSEGRILALSAGQEIKDIQIRLQAAAVVRGRVTDEDGDPLANAQVSVLRQTYASGHSRWEQAGSERTNDLGEYRVPGLAPGNYFVSVNPPPDFKSLIESAGGKTTASKPEMSYQATYYPGTTDRSQASPIELHASDEFPVNFSLVQSQTLSIRGSVVNLPPNSSAVITLQSREFHLLLNGAEIHKDGSFVVPDVAPGAYTIVATVENAPAPMMARQSLQITGSNVGGLRLAPQTGATISGRLRLEAKATAGGTNLSQLYLSLYPLDPDEDLMAAFGFGEGFSSLTPVKADGSFIWRNVPQGNYYVRVSGDNNIESNWYVKSVIAGGREAVDSGVAVNGGASFVDVIASADGGVLEGVVTNPKGEPEGNAVVVAVPEARLRSRVDRFRKTVSDQRGAFSLRGIPPGEYSLFAWESVDGEAYYNPDFLRSFEGQGISLRVAEGERKSLQVIAIATAEDEQH